MAFLSLRLKKPKKQHVRFCFKKTFSHLVDFLLIFITFVILLQLHFCIRLLFKFVH